MKKLKVISVVLSLCILLSLITPTLAADSSADKNTPSSWAAEKVALAIEAGIVPPHLQGDYQKDITKYEFAELIIRLLEVNIGLNIEDAAVKLNIPSYGNLFRDITDPIVNYSYSLDLFYYEYFNYENMMFNPEKAVTRQDMAYAIYNLSKNMAKHYYDDVPPFADEYMADYYTRKAIRYVKARRIVNGTGNNTYSPKLNVTKEQAIITAYNLFLTDAKSFDEIGFTSLLYSNEDVYIENEYFILHIGKGFIYSKELEQQLIQGFIEAEKITGLKINPEKYKKSKMILEVTETLTYGFSDNYYSLNNEDLILNNSTNYVKYVNIAARILYRRNALKNSYFNYDVSSAYGNVMQFIANKKYNICSWAPYLGYENSYVTPTELALFIDQRFGDITFYNYESNSTQPPVIVNYLFNMFTYEKYGVEKLNEFYLFTQYYNVATKELRDKYIIDFFGVNVKADFNKWYIANDGKYTAPSDNTYTSEGFIHDTPPIKISGIYNYLPYIRQNYSTFTSLCFYTTKKPIRIDLRDAYKYVLYKGDDMGTYNFYVRCNSTTSIKTYDINGKLIGTNTFAGSYGSQYTLRRGAYYDITGEGLCEIKIIDTSY